MESELAIMATKGFAWIFTILGCLFCLEYCAADLKLIQAVFRHGHRTPMAGSSDLYPNDPYKNESYEPLGPGALTNTGKLAVYKLGEFLRARYGDFLGDIYSPNLIRFRADEVERVIMTGELVAAGLFPPTGVQKWHPYIYWQPIPIWTEPIDTDVLFNGIFCTNLYKIRQEVEAKDESLQDRYNKHQDLFEYMSYNAGSNVTHRRAFFLRQQLFAQWDLGLKLPEWTKPLFINDQLDKIAAYDVVIQSYTTEMKQLMGGTWIKEWLDHVSDYINGNSTKPRKAFMYPAHEYNIGAILVTLDDYDYQVPAYASCIVFELHEVSGEYFVQVLHKNKDKVRYLHIPGCDGQFCPLTTFIKLHKAYLPDDAKSACGEIDFDLF